MASKQTDESKRPSLTSNDDLPTISPYCAYPIYASNAKEQCGEALAYLVQHAGWSLVLDWICKLAWRDRIDLLSGVKRCVRRMN